MTMMTTAKKYSEREARQRRERWEVEWCESCPLIEGTEDRDIDQANMVCEYFLERAEAESRMVALEAARLDFFGQPAMNRQEWQLDWVDDETGREFWMWETEQTFYIEDGTFYD